MGNRGIQAAHPEAMFIGCLAGMDGARIDQDHAAGRCKMSGMLMDKRLGPLFDYTDHVVFMEVARVGMSNMGSL